MFATPPLRTKAHQPPLNPILGGPTSPLAGLKGSVTDNLVLRVGGPQVVKKCNRKDQEGKKEKEREKMPNTTVQFIHAQSLTNPKAELELASSVYEIFFSQHDP